MKISKYQFLPETTPYVKGSDWNSYVNSLYYIFSRDFLLSQPIFMGKKVSPRIVPLIKDRAEGFNHLLTEGARSLENRKNVDLDRCERIAWVRKVIENQKEAIGFCPIPMIWNKGGIIHILTCSERYLVVLEKKSDYYRLITAFYLNYDHSFIKKVKEYHKYKKVPL